MALCNFLSIFRLTLLFMKILCEMAVHTSLIHCNLDSSQCSKEPILSQAFLTTDWSQQPFLSLYHLWPLSTFYTLLISLSFLKYYFPMASLNNILLFLLSLSRSQYVCPLHSLKWWYFSLIFLVTTKKYVSTYLSILSTVYIFLILKNKTGIIFYILSWLKR